MFAAEGHPPATATLPPAGRKIRRDGEIRPGVAPVHGPAQAGAGGGMPATWGSSDESRAAAGLPLTQTTISTSKW